jgi:dissimilatory sulfite reductase (desulfoviridin) alpha/beta subunit
MIINLESQIGKTSNNEDGLRLFELLEEGYLNDSEVILVVSHFLPLSSSFLNTSIGMFLEKYGFDSFKKKIKIRSNKSQFERIRDYIYNYINIYGIK